MLIFREGSVGESWRGDYWNDYPRDMEIAVWILSLGGAELAIAVEVLYFSHLAWVWKKFITITGLKVSKNECSIRASLFCLLLVQQQQYNTTAAVPVSQKVVHSAPSDSCF